jgi:hypothetical protein
MASPVWHDPALFADEREPDTSYTSADAQALHRRAWPRGWA